MLENDSERGKSQGESSEWDRLLYEEAWRQYCHEDNLNSSRNKLFWTIQGVILTLFFAIAGFMLKESSDLLLEWPGMLILFLLAIVGIAICIIWRKVAENGNGYVLVRWAVARYLEQEHNRHGVNICDMEDKWKNGSKSGTSLSVDGKNWRPFAAKNSLSDLKIPKYIKGGELQSIKSLTIIIILFWITLSVMLMYMIICGISPIHLPCFHDAI